MSTVIDTAALDAAARYLKLRNLAESGTAAEKGEIRKQLARMEEKDPELRERADRVAASLLPPPPPWERIPDAPPEPRAPSSKWTGVFGSFLQQAVEAGADRAAESLSGAHRFQPLDRGDVDVKDHACATGQVCLEIRVRIRDIRNDASREDLMEGLEKELRRAAREAR